MRQSEKNDFRLARESFRIGIGKVQGFRFFVVGEARKDLGERFAGELPRRHRDKIDMWVRQQQADKFLAGVTGSANYRDLGFAAADSGLYRFLHNAQCVFRLRAIATNFGWRPRRRRPNLLPAPTMFR